jgi:hypothetical protein
VRLGEQRASRPIAGAPPAVGRLGDEVTIEQVRQRGVGGLRDRGGDLAASAVAADAVLAHDPGDPLVVDPPVGGHTVIAFGGDPWPPTGGVRGVHRADRDLAQPAQQWADDRQHHGDFADRRPDGA